MTDEEFEFLKKKIEDVMFGLSYLQKIYRKETGKDYIPPLRLDHQEKSVNNYDIRGNQ